MNDIKRKLLFFVLLQVVSFGMGVWLDWRNDYTYILFFFTIEL